MKMNIYAVLRDTIARISQNLWPEVTDLHFSCTEPDIAEHGDYATNVAMVLAKKIQKSPPEIAATLLAALQEDAIIRKLVHKTEIANPGFINFFLNAESLAAQAGGFLTDLGSKKQLKEKIVIEHTNVNPNKAMHIGHLRNAILGDTINTVLRRAGFQTEVQYYVDDTGVQVADTYLGLKESQLTQNPGEKFDHFCWRVYSSITQAYETKPELLTKRTLVLHEIEKGANPTAQEVKKLATQILEEHLETMSKLHIGYSLLVWESDILGFGFWQTAFETLKKSPVFLKETEGKNKGCWVIKSEEDYDSHDYSPDKVIVKSDGTVTYTGKDVAYHLWKYNVLGKDFLYSAWKDAPQATPLATTNQQGKKSNAYGHADRVYNVIDVRQSYPQAMVKLTLDSLGFKKHADNLRHVSYGIVSLSEHTAKKLDLSVETGKKVYSMSGRKGIGIKVDDLLDIVEEQIKKAAYEVTSARGAEAISPREVAVGAIKYFMLRYSPQTDIIFDLDEALSLEGNTGPYIQYAHARMASILDKSGEKTCVFPKHLALSSEEERLLKKIYQWPEVLERVTHDLNVNALTSYAFELANTFNSFYEAQPVLKAEGMLREQRIALVGTCREVLADVLSVLGIQAPEKM